MLYAELEPFGQPELDMQHTMDRFSFTQASGAKKESEKPFEFDEFSLNKIRDEVSKPKRKKKKQGQTVEEQKNILLSFASMHNASVGKHRPIQKKRKK